MRWIAIVAACFAGLAGCYSPKIRDCEQACGPNNSCPSGLTCSNTVCRDPSRVDTACTEVEPDASPPTADVAPENCTWALSSTNFTMVDVADPNPTPWDVTADDTFTTGGLDGHAVPQTDGPNLWLVHHSRFTVAEGVTLTIAGAHPLVIAADTIEIKGRILVTNGAGDASCDAQRGADNCIGGAGGGGGGYGGTGGDGGGGAGAGGTITGVLSSPLRGGCPGAQGGDGRTGGGDATPRLGGEGGAGGGALQLSARLSITVEGSIEASGGGGKLAQSDPAGGAACPGLKGRAAGGGGGGGGGTIFIESCATVIAPTAKLCANGGGGGGGAGGGSIDHSFDGAAGSCDAAAAGGDSEVTGTARGGNGGFDGVPAGNGGIDQRGGGGGGGAVGRIHILQAAGPPATAGATIRPAANRSQ